MRARLVLLAATLVIGCGGGSPAGPRPPGPTPTPAPDIVPGVATGPTRIAYLGAEPPPGARVTGCGAEGAGCAGRVRMTFELTPRATGHVLWVASFLHARSSRACYLGRTDGFELAAGQTRAVEIVFADWDACATPFEVATMAVVVEGTVEVASRQEWAVRYAFEP